MKRVGIVLASIALMLALAACAGEADTAGPPAPDPGPAPTETVFVGQIDATDALIAVVVERDAVMVYVCGQDDSWESLTAWFEGTARDGEFTSLPGGWDLELSGRFDGTAWAGDLNASGRVYAWTAEPAAPNSAAGLYVLDTDNREAGLIVGNDLATAGVYYGKSSGRTATVRVDSNLNVTSSPSTVEVFSDVYGGRTFTLRPVARTSAPPRITPDRQLRQALTRALPGLRRYELIAFDDAAIVKLLRDVAATPSDAPQYVSLPVVDTRGVLRTEFDWTVYHHDVRDPNAQSCLLDARDAPRCEPISGPSLTFQGMPNLSFEAYRDLLHRARTEPEQVAKELSDERRYQLSTLGIVGDDLVGTYSGLSLDAPSVIQGLRSIFEVSFGTTKAEQLLDLTSHTYLVYNRLYYDEPIEMPAPPSGAGSGALHVHAGERHGQEQGEHHHPSQPARIVTPQNHFDEFDDFPILRPMMVADATIWDADAQEWLIDTFVERADYVANVQANAFNWLQVFPDAPAGSSTLDQWSNALAVRTQIGGYWRLTPAGQAALQYPTDSCASTDSFIDEVRKLSPDSKTVDNEYWAWWTNHQAYGLGCAYVGTFGNTGRNSAVSWQHISSQTLDATASTFMHETGHLMNGTHGGPTHPWANASQRCRLIGLLEVGPTGPSLMHPRIVGTTRTNCFAPTLEGDTTKKNMTRIAEHMHDNLD